VAAFLLNIGKVLPTSGQEVEIRRLVSGISDDDPRNLSRLYELMSKVIIIMMKQKGNNDLGKLIEQVTPVFWLKVSLIF
jgi:hypothetical protein